MRTPISGTYNTGEPVSFLVSRIYYWRIIGIELRDLQLGADFHQIREADSSCVRERFWRIFFDLADWSVKRVDVPGHLL